MGCLLELFFEIFVEGIFELIGYCYLKLMQLIIPNRGISEKTKKTIKNTVTIFAALLFVIIIIGLILLAQEDPFIKDIGKYITYIPLTIVVLQVALGLLVRIISHFKK